MAVKLELNPMKANKSYLMKKRKNSSSELDNLQYLVIPQNITQSKKWPKQFNRIMSTKLILSRLPMCHMMLPVSNGYGDSCIDIWNSSLLLLKKLKWHESKKP